MTDRTKLSIPLAIISGLSAQIFVGLPKALILIPVFHVVWWYAIGWWQSRPSRLINALRTYREWRKDRLISVDQHRQLVREHMDWQRNWWRPW
jgi:hypothetical protein